jgi:hypothetical protein
MALQQQVRAPGTNWTSPEQGEIVYNRELGVVAEDEQGPQVGLHGRKWEALEKSEGEERRWLKGHYCAEEWEHWYEWGNLGHEGWEHGEAHEEHSCQAE